MLTIRFRPEADLEYIEAQQWYRERRPGLELEFMECVDEVLQRIRHNPFMYPIRMRHLRRAVVRRFPYSIYYDVTETQIKIFAVFHSSRNPRVLQSRIG
jgi:plasmid stabilization system protein ParE